MAVAEAPTSPVVEGVQANFLLSTARHPALIGGRGAGKSVGSILKAVTYVNEHPGCDLMYTVPNWDQVEKILLPRMRSLYGHMEGSAWAWQEKKARIVFPTLRSQMFVRPALEADQLRGGDYAAAGMDEIGSDNQRDAFFILQAAIRQPGYPNQLWVTTTPQVSSPWIKQLWHDNVHPITERSIPFPKEYPIFRVKTVDNKHLPEWQREELVAEWAGTRMGRQELEGEFLAVEGVAFPELGLIHRREPPPDIHWIKESVGLDPGATDPTAIAWWKQGPDKRVWLVDEYYKRNADPADWVRWLRERNITRVVVDPSVSDKQLLYWRQMYGIFFYRARIKSFIDRYQLWTKYLMLRDPAGRDIDGEAPLHAYRLPSCYISNHCQNMWEELNNLAFARPKGSDYETDKWTPHAADHLYDAGAYALAEFESRYDIPPSRPVGHLVRR